MNFIQTHVRTLYGVLFCVLLPALSQAQIMFERHYGGSGDEAGINALQSSDGGYFVTGSTDSYGLGGFDIYVIRINEYGDPLWSKTYGGAGDDLAISLIQTFDGNYVISGYTDSYGTGNSDVYCLKMDQNGDTIWTKTYGSTGSDQCNSAIECSDGGLFFVGYTPNLLSGYWDVFCIKTDLQGDTVWTRTFNKKNANSGFSAVQTTDGGYLIAATTSTYSVSNSKDVFVIKLNEFGDSLWTKTIDKGLDDWGSCVVELGNGDLVVSGRTNSMGYGGYDTFIARYNSSGDEIWFKNYGGTADDSGGKIIVTNDSSIVFSGTTYSFGHGAGDLYLIKTNLNGDTLWTKTYGGGNDDMGGGSIYQTNDNGFITGGITNSFGNGVEMYLVKTRADGFAILKDDGNTLNTIRVFPNPCNGICNLSLQNSTSTSICIQIFDLDGKMVYRKNNLLLNSLEERIDLTTLQSGMYFLNLSGNDIHESTKLLFQK